MDSENVRTAEILINDEWQPINPVEVRRGMTFRLFEPDKTPVLGIGNSTSWIAINDAYYNDDGIITIDIF